MLCRLFGVFVVSPAWLAFLTTLLAFHAGENNSGHGGVPVSGRCGVGSAQFLPGVGSTHAPHTEHAAGTDLGDAPLIVLVINNSSTLTCIYVNETESGHVSAFAPCESAFQFKKNAMKLKWAPFSRRLPVAEHFLVGCVTHAPGMPELVM